MVRLLMLAVSLCAGQALAGSFEIKIPEGIPSESFYIRYVLSGQSFGGQAPPQRAVTSYRIDTTVAGHPANRIKAIVYAPGCAIRTLDIPISDQPWSFTCEPLANIPIKGRLTQPERLYGREVEIQAKYIARWAAAFLGLDNATIPIIPAGDPVSLAPDGSFQIAVPDFSPRAGDLRIQATDKATGDLTALLIPTVPRYVAAKVGALQVLPGYPPEIVFEPCALNSSQRHDPEGFAQRPDMADACR
jgi:hypothetical protein